MDATDQSPLPYLFYQTLLGIAQQSYRYHRIRILGLQVACMYYYTIILHSKGLLRIEFQLTDYYSNAINNNIHVLRARNCLLLLLKLITGCDQSILLSRKENKRHNTILCERKQSVIGYLINSPQTLLEVLNLANNFKDDKYEQKAMQLLCVSTWYTMNRVAVTGTKERD